MNTLKNIALTISLCVVVACQQPQPQDSIKHILVIGVDGMSPDGLQNAKTPMMDSMIKNGAATMNGRAVLPSSSGANWASMMMGAGVEQHGITVNTWKRDNYQLPPIVATEKGTFPTIFTLFKDQRPDAHIGAVYDWGTFGRFFEKSEVDFDIDGDHEDDTTKEVVAYIKKHRPEFTFVQLDHVDHAGHSTGYRSSGYYQSVQKADSLITEMVNATKEAGIFEHTLFIVVADHGGLGFSHGGETPAEMTVPFILYGAGIKQGYLIEETVYQYDNAATVAYAMGLKTPQAWVGRPVKSAFVGNEKPKLVYKRKEQLTPPKIMPDAGYFEPAGGIFRNDSATVVMQNPNAKGSIRYTLDGTLPTLQNSRLYKAPFYVRQTTVVTAAIFKDGKIKTPVAEGNFRVVSKHKTNPVKFRVYYDKNLEKLPNFSSLKPAQSGFISEFSHKNLFKQVQATDQIAVVLESFLKIDKKGKYTFFTNSDDGSKLYVNGKLLVDNDGNHSVRERSGSIALRKGKHLIRVEFYNSGGGYHLDARYKGENVPKQIIPVDKLYRTAH